MTESPSPLAAALIRGSYLALIAWQWVWVSGWISGEPGVWSVTLVITLLMMVPLKGLLGMDSKAITWAGFMVIGLFVIAVGEAWTQPSDRLLGGVQIGLCLIYLTGLWRFGRRR